jgi:hypothetical protein
MVVIVHKVLARVAETSPPDKFSNYERRSGRSGCHVLVAAMDPDGSFDEQSETLVVQPLDQTIAAQLSGRQSRTM